MNRTSRTAATWLTATLIASSSALTGCSPTPVIVLPEAKVQKISKGASADFDGWLLTSSALDKLLQRAERCDQPEVK